MRLPPQDHENLTGRRLKDGEYLVRWMLGQGDTSKVYLVSHPTLSIPFAMKQFHTDQPLPEPALVELDAVLQNSNPIPSDAQPAEMIPTSGGEYTDRFVREALFLARLQHPAIPALYDYFFENGNWYLIMDYIPGHSLTEQIHNHAPMPPLEALSYAMQLCKVLDYLHTQTLPIVFRNLKPTNILLKPDSTLALIDFSIACYLNEDGININPDTSSPGYVAPEQHRNQEPPDTRSDLYSLGVILYEMLTGHHPQEGEDLTALRSINPPLSYALSGLVRLAMRTDPDQRFQSAYTLYLALERAYKIEERRVYQRYALAQMGDVHSKKETLILPTLQLEHLEYEKITPYSSAKPEKTPPIETELPLPSLEQRQHIREALYRARQGLLSQAQLVSVDESPKRRSLQSHSQIVQQATQKIHQSPAGPPAVVQPRPRGIQRQATHPATTRRVTPRRIIQISFLLAMVVFLVMTSLLVYQRIVPQHQNTILHSMPTTGLHTRPTQIDSKQAMNSSWQVLPSPPVANADNIAAYVKEQGHTFIYMNGGYLGSDSSSANHYDHSLYRYNIDTASWEIVSKAFPAMVNNAAAVDEYSQIFFTAGYSPDTHTVVSALYKYQPKNGLLQKINAPAQIRIGFGNAMLADQQGHLYITQGFMQAGRNSYARAGTGWYRYDIATQQWHQLASLPIGLGYVILTNDSRGGILLLGGAIDAEQHLQTNKIYRYNITLNTWTQQANIMPQLFSGETACQIWPDQMAFIGGYDAVHNTAINSTWLFNMQTLDWQKLSPLPASGSLLGTATCDGNGHLFLTRGVNTAKRPTQDFWMLTVQSG